MAKKKAAKKFQRSERSGKPPNKKDSKGTIQVVVRSVDSSGVPVKGNMSKSLTVKEAKVSEVFSAIEGSLF